MTGAATAPITPEELAEWQSYVGRTEIRREVLSVATLRRFASAAGASLDVETTPPPLGHWAFFLEPAVATLEEDGHPRRGGFMPPVRLPRRMFAAATFTFHAPLILGATGELHLTIADVRHRPGKAGDLIFVDIARHLIQAGQERVFERQTIVYRGLGKRTAPIEPTQPPAAAEVWTPGPVDLFRFSAVTFNAHRIHYDAAYTQQHEGYPGLVVHGPFTATKLCALIARTYPDQPMRHFEFRANAPLFVDQPIVLRLGAQPSMVEAIRCDGDTAMSALAGFTEDAPR